MSKYEKMFGMTMAELKRLKPHYVAPGMWAMSILSDVQEVIESGNDNMEHVRQALNVAKYWIQESREVKSDDPRDR